jgi:hypothetical protein
MNDSTRRYREVAPLSQVDAAYIAGLIDGEGTITLSRRHANDRRQLVEEAIALYRKDGKPLPPNTAGLNLVNRLHQVA